MEELEIGTWRVQRQVNRSKLFFRTNFRAVVVFAASNGYISLLHWSLRINNSRNRGSKTWKIRSDVDVFLARLAAICKDNVQVLDLTSGSTNCATNQVLFGRSIRYITIIKPRLLDYDDQGLDFNLSDHAVAEQSYACLKWLLEHRFQKPRDDTLAIFDIPEQWLLKFTSPRYDPIESSRGAVLRVENIWRSLRTGSGEETLELSKSLDALGWRIWSNDFVGVKKQLHITELGSHWSHDHIVRRAILGGYEDIVKLLKQRAPKFFHLQRRDSLVGEAQLIYALYGPFRFPTDRKTHTLRGDAALNAAAGRDGDIKLLQALVDSNYSDMTNVVIEAAQAARLDILEWLNDHGIIKDLRDTWTCQAPLSVLKWARQKNYKFGRYEIFFARGLEELQFLWACNDAPFEVKSHTEKDSEMNYFCRSVPCLRWLIAQGVKFDSRNLLRKCIEAKHIETIRWIAEDSEMDFDLAFCLKEVTSRLRAHHLKADSCVLTGEIELNALQEYLIDLIPHRRSDSVQYTVESQRDQQT